MTKLYDDSTVAATGSLAVFSTAFGGAGPLYESFTTGSTNAVLTSIALELSDANPNDLQSFTVSLFANTGTVVTPTAASTGTTLTSGSVNDSSLTTTASFITLTTNAYTLTANTTYWIGLSNSMLGGGAQWYYTSAASATGTGTTGTTGQSLEHGTTVTAASQFIMTVNATSLCFATGAMVLTSKGEVPVESLQEGDLVVGLRSGQLRAVRWVGYRDVDLRTHPDPDSINPVRVCADAFGPGQPHRDLILSPNHALYVDGHLIAVRYLLNGATIRQEQWERVGYYHVELDAHDVMLVDGMTAESFLDVGNRGAFSNGGEPVMLHPDFARKTWEAEACAPDMPKGEELTQLRHSLLDNALSIGHAFTEDPDISVMAMNRCIRPIEVADGYRFSLPKGTSNVRINSRSFRPSDIRPDGSDARMLGVGVVGIKLDNKYIALDDKRLTSGWHAPEPGLRWTQGEASLRTGGAKTLTLTLMPGPRYWVTVEPAQDAHVAA